MKKRIGVIILTSLAMIVSCKKYDAKGNEIKDYDELAKASWILGDWEKKDSLGCLTESWQILDDSTYVGQSYYIQNEKDTLHNEQIQMTQEKEHLIYSATIKGENNDEPVFFQLTKDADSLLVFENPKHDYPQKIEYKLTKNNGLMASVSGKQYQKNSKENYMMYRKK